ncbi:hypothetical protein ABZ907_20215 [Nonomuraea wenchangensis]
MTKLVPFGASVRVVEGVEGLVPLDELLAMPVETREQVSSGRRPSQGDHHQPGSRRPLIALPTRRLILIFCRLDGTWPRGCTPSDRCERATSPKSLKSARCDRPGPVSGPSEPMAVDVGVYRSVRYSYRSVRIEGWPG